MPIVVAPSTSDDRVQQLQQRVHAREHGHRRDHQYQAIQFWKIGQLCILAAALHRERRGQHR